MTVDAAGVAGHTAPESADAEITAPDLAPADAGEVVEMRPQVVADAPSQLIREICNRMSYPHARKTTSRANPGVAEKRTTPANARQAVAQGNGGARKKATQGGVSRKGNQSCPRRSARKSAGRKRCNSSSCSSSSSSSDHQRLYKELCDMEMPLVDNGNMKCFHKAFLSYFPHLLMFKEKYGHLHISGYDPKKEWPELQQWLKNIRATMPKYDRSGSGRFAVEPMYYDLLVSAGVTVRVQTNQYEFDYVVR
jgi:hypothetical protein